MSRKLKNKSEILSKGPAWPDGAKKLADGSVDCIVW